jgi:hypothetical protein
VQATASRVQARAGNFKQAAEHCGKATAALRAAASSFEERDPLRKSLLAAAQMLSSNLNEFAALPRIVP